LAPLEFDVTAAPAVVNVISVLGNGKSAVSRAPVMLRVWSVLGVSGWSGVTKASMPASAATILAVTGPAQDHHEEDRRQQADSSPQSAFRGQDLIPNRIQAIALDALQARLTGCGSTVSVT
jgi:hypothetical protein